MTGHLVRAGNSPEYARKVSVDAARQSERGAVSTKAKPKPSYGERVRAAQSEAELVLRGPRGPRGRRIEVDPSQWGPLHDGPYIPVKPRTI